MLSQHPKQVSANTLIEQLQKGVKNPASDLKALIADAEKFMAIHRSTLEKNPDEYKPLIKAYKKALNTYSDRLGKISRHLLLEFDGLADDAKNLSVNHARLANYTANLVAETVDDVLSRKLLDERTIAFQGKMAIMKRRFEKGDYLTASFLQSSFTNDAALSRLSHTKNGLSTNTLEILSSVEKLLLKGGKNREILINTRSTAIIPPLDFFTGKIAQFSESIEKINDDIINIGKTEAAIKKLQESITDLLVLTIGVGAPEKMLEQMQNLLTNAEKQFPQFLPKEILELLKKSVDELKQKDVYVGRVVNQLLIDISEVRTKQKSKEKIRQLQESMLPFQEKITPLVNEFRKIQLEMLIQPLDVKIQELEDKIYIEFESDKPSRVKKLQAKLDKLKAERTRLLTTPIDIKKELLENTYLGDDLTRWSHHRTQLSAIKDTYKQLEHKKTLLEKKSQTEKTQVEILNIVQELGVLTYKYKELKKKTDVLELTLKRNKITPRDNLLYSTMTASPAQYIPKTYEEITSHRASLNPGEFFRQASDMTDKRHSVSTPVNLDDKRYKRSLELEDNSERSGFTTKLKSLVIPLKPSTIIHHMPISIIKPDAELIVPAITKLTLELNEIEKSIEKSNGAIWEKLAEIEEYKDSQPQGTKGKKRREQVETILEKLKDMKNYVSTLAHKGPISHIDRDLLFVQQQIKSSDNNHHLHFDQPKKKLKLKKDTNLVLHLQELEKLLQDQINLVEKRNDLKANKERALSQLHRDQVFETTIAEENEAQSEIKAIVDDLIISFPDQDHAEEKIQPNIEIVVSAPEEKPLPVTIAVDAEKKEKLLTNPEQTKTVGTTASMLMGMAENNEREDKQSSLQRVTSFKSLTASRATGKAIQAKLDLYQNTNENTKTQKNSGSGSLRAPTVKSDQLVDIQGLINKFSVMSNPEPKKGPAPTAVASGENEIMLSTTTKRKLR